MESSGPTTTTETCNCPHPPAGNPTPQGLSRPLALLLTLLTLLIAVYIQNPSLAILNKFTNHYGHRLPLPLSFLSPTPPPSQPPSEAARTAAILARLSASQLSSRERTLEELNQKPIVRTRLLQALAALYNYPNRAQSVVTRKRKAYARLDRADKLLLTESRVGYLGKIEEVEKRVLWNCEVVEEILRHACAYYGVSWGEVEKFANVAEEGGKVGGDYSQVAQAIKHFVRDFSEEGEVERRRMFGLVKGWLGREFPMKEAKGDDGQSTSGRNDMQILVPGCGVGGLLWEVADMGFQAVGVEWSFYMNIMAHFIGSAGPEPLSDLPPSSPGNSGAHDEKNHSENERKQKQHIIYPYIDWWSHHATNANMSRPIHFPYSNSPLSPFISSSSSSLPPLSPASHNIHLHETDFTTLHPPFSPPQYSCIITLFFIDTAQSIPTYIRKIHQYLLPGGVWINLGPLLYGTKPWVELSLEEVVKVAEWVGFEFDDVVGGMRGREEEGEWKEGETGYEGWMDTLGNGKVVGVRAAYNVDWKGLGKNEYLAQGWVARKVR